MAAGPFVALGVRMNFYGKYMLQLKISLTRLHLSQLLLDSNRFAT
jgi:hypothetical protein